MQVARDVRQATLATMHECFQSIPDLGQATPSRALRSTGNRQRLLSSATYVCGLRHRPSGVSLGEWFRPIPTHQFGGELHNQLLCQQHEWS